jgi:DHA3 family macrolide efflux protein-like MFS transporter
METTVTNQTFRGYLAFWSGQLFSILGSSVVQFVIIYWITIVTRSTLFLAIASFFAFLPQIIITPFAGVLIDRWNRKVVIAVSDSVQALTTFFIIILFWLNAQNVWLIILINSIRGACQAFHWPSINAIIPIMIPKKHLSRMNAINYLFTGVMNTIGPVIGSTFLEFLRIQEILWIDVITYVIAIIPLVLITIPKIKIKDSQEYAKSFFNELKEGFTFLSLVPGLLILLFVATLINFFGQPFSTLMPYFVTIIHSGSALDLGFVMASIQAGMFVGAIIVMIKKNWKHKVFIIFAGILIGDIGHLVITFAPLTNYSVISFGGFIFAFVIPFINTMFLTILQTSIPPHAQGRVMSIAITIAAFVSPLGMILSGTLAQIIGVIPLFIASATIDMAIVICVWTFSNVKSINYDQYHADNYIENNQSN